MNTPWIGSRRIAVIPAIVQENSRNPIFDAPPPNWRDEITQRIFYDPDPISGIDRSLRAYYHAVSYGKALLEAEIFDPITVPWSHCGPTQDAAINATPNVQNFEYACVVFPRVTRGANPCDGWAFYNNPPFNFNPRRNGTNRLRNWCYVSMNASLGVWAMEVMHMLTWFGDLYQTGSHPGNFDNMACSCGTQLSTFTKLKLGWLDPNNIQSITTSGTSIHTLHAVALLQPPPPRRVTAVRIDGDPQHYFLVEARLRVDPYEQVTPGISDGIPSEGVIIYEIDESCWAPAVLLTPVALSQGQNYKYPNGRFEVKVVAAVPGGFDIETHLQNAVWNHNDLTVAAKAPLAAGNPAGYTWDVDCTQHVVYRGKDDNHIHELWFHGKWNHNDLTVAANAPIATGDPAGYTWGANQTQHVVYRGIDNHIHELWFPKDGQWNYNDLTMAANAPIAAGDPAGYTWNVDQTQHVVYRGVDNHIHELWFSNGNWNHNDLTVTANAPIAAGNPAGYTWDVDQTQHVVYRGKDDDHIHELRFSNGNWNHKDLTLEAGTRAAGNPAGYTWDVDQTQHVVYRGKYDNHIHELWFSNGSWNSNRLTVAANAPIAAGDPAAYTWDLDQTQHVVYRGRDDNHIHELWFHGKWNHNDLTVAANAPMPAGEPAGHTWAVHRTQHVVYRGIDNHIHELCFSL